MGQFESIAALDRAAATAIPGVKKILEQAIDALRAGVSLEAIERAISHHSAAPILDSPAWRDMAEVLARAYAEEDGPIRAAIDDAVSRALVEAPLAEAATITAASLDNYAVDYLRERGASQVTLVVDATRQAIRETVISTFTGPLDIRDAASQILKDKEFGLNSGQQKTLLNYVSDLQQQVDKGEIEEADLTRLSKTRFTQLRRVRARLVAQTESYNAGNSARRATWKEAADQGDLDTSQYVLRWVTRAIHVCPRCHALHGKIAEIDGGEFVSDPVATGRYAGEVIRIAHPTVHPGCYCGVETANRADVA